MGFLCKHLYLSYLLAMLELCSGLTTQFSASQWHQQSTWYSLSVQQMLTSHLKRHKNSRPLSDLQLQQKMIQLLDTGKKLLAPPFRLTDISFITKGITKGFTWCFHCHALTVFRLTVSP